MRVTQMRARSILLALGVIALMTVAVRPAGAAPATTETGTLSGVSCTSSTFCLAVGAKGSSDTTKPQTKALVYVYNGSGWQEVAEPAVPRGVNSLDLKSVSCASPTSCYAVGFQENNVYNPTSQSTGTTSYLVAERWDGAGWTQVPIDLPGHTNAISVSCAVGGCIAVGTYSPDGSYDITRAVAWTLRGGTFRRVATAPRPFPISELGGVSCTTPSSCNAVGTERSAGTPLIEHWDGARWTTFSGVGFPPDARVAMPITELSGVSCPALGDCVAVGTDGNTGETGALFVQNRLNYGPWRYSEPQGRSTADDGPAFSDVSCLSFTTCATTGFVVSRSNTKFLMGWRDPTVGHFVERTTDSAYYATSCAGQACSWVGGTVDDPVDSLPAVARGTGLHPVEEVLPAPSS